MDSVVAGNDSLKCFTYLVLTQIVYLRRNDYLIEFSIKRITSGISVKGQSIDDKDYILCTIPFHTNS